MMDDYSEEVKKLIGNCNKEDIEYGKNLDFLLTRLEAIKEEIENEILKCEKLIFTDKQIKGDETRYALFFVYGKRKGRKYLITFRGIKLRVITAFPLGRKTLKKYLKKGLNIS